MLTYTLNYNIIWLQLLYPEHLMCVCACVNVSLKLVLEEVEHDA